MTLLPACVVVGAGPGLGSAVARRFAAAGHPVGVLGRSTDPLDHLVAELTATGAKAVAAVADAADPDDLRAGLSRLSEHLSPVGALVYNAASYTDGALAGLLPERLQADYAVNVTGALTAVQHVLPSLRQQHGTALLTGGGAALYPSGQYASPSLTKSGLRLCWAAGWGCSSGRPRGGGALARSGAGFGDGVTGGQGCPAAQTSWTPTVAPQSRWWTSTGVPSSSSSYCSPHWRSAVSTG